jgi:hypothetical protein
MLAAPILATFQLLGQYMFRKMLDQDPWPEPRSEELPPAFGLRKRLLRWWKSVTEKIPNRTIINSKNPKGAKHAKEPRTPDRNPG